MPTTLISPGMPTVVMQNISYALPARVCILTAANPVEVSVNNVAWSALTSADTVGAITSAAFVRCTGSNTVVTCKVY